MGSSPLAIYSLPPQSEYLFMLHQSMTQNLHVSNIKHSTFKDSAAALCFRDRSEITLLMREWKPWSV